VGGRWGHHCYHHESSDPDFDVSHHCYDAYAVDYLGVVYPFEVRGRNGVCSLSARTAYDFTQHFAADIWQMSTERRQSRSSGTDKDSFEAVFGPQTWLNADRTTHLTHELSEVLTSDVTTSLQFTREGTVDAVGPAVGVAIGPRCAAGVTVNFFTDNLFSSRPISSSTVAEYSGMSENVSTLVTKEDEKVEFSYMSPMGPGSGKLDDSSDRTVKRQRRTIYFDGRYEERNEYADLFGVNAMLGVLCKPTERLRAAVSVDLPWRGRTTHTVSTRNTVRTLDSSGAVVDVSETAETVTQDAVFTFPMHSTAGAAWNWTDSLLTSLDVRHTQWSRFSYQAEGGEKINPLDGSPHGENPISDCWGVACGAEVLLDAGDSASVPVRCGLGWDQQPAIGQADQYWSASIGSGVAIGNGDRHVRLDTGYTYT